MSVPKHLCDDGTMIRTYIIPSQLPKAAADVLNRASGAVYTRTLITHYRVYRKRGKRSGRDTGQPKAAVACDEQEAARL